MSLLPMDKRAKELIVLLDNKKGILEGNKPSVDKGVIGIYANKNAEVKKLVTNAENLANTAFTGVALTSVDKIAVKDAYDFLRTTSRQAETVMSPRQLYFQKEVDGIRTARTQINQTVKNVNTYVSDSVAGAINSAEAAGGSVLQAIKENSLVSSVSDAITTLNTAIDGTVEEVVGAVKPYIDSINGVIDEVTGVVNGVIDTVNGVVDEAYTIVGEVTGIVTDVIDGTISIVDNSVKEVTGVVSDVVGTVNGTIDAVVSEVTDVVGSVASIIPSEYMSKFITQQNYVASMLNGIKIPVAGITGVVQKIDPTNGLIQIRESSSNRVINVVQHGYKVFDNGTHVSTSDEYVTHLPAVGQLLKDYRETHGNLHYPNLRIEILQYPDLLADYRTEYTNAAFMAARDSADKHGNIPVTPDTKIVPEAEYAKFERELNRIDAKYHALVQARKAS